MKAAARIEATVFIRQACELSQHRGHFVVVNPIYLTLVVLFE